MGRDRIFAASFVVLVSTAIIGFSAGVTGASFTGSSSNPDQSMVTATVQPPATQNAAVSVSGGTVNLSWTATPTAPNGHTLTYLVLRNGVQIGTTTGLSYSDTPAGDGTYSYTIRTKLAQGSGFFTSGDSAAASGVSDRTAPTMSATCNGGACTGWFNGAVSVVVSGADGSGVGMGTATTNVDGAGAATSAAPRTVTVSGESATHSVVYSGADAIGNASGSSSQTVKIDLTAPTAATGLVATIGAVGGPVTVDLTWTAGTDALSGVAGYTVYWVLAATCPAASPANYPSSAVVGAVTSYSISGLVSGSKYCAYLTTTDGAGNVSAASAAAGPTKAR